METLSKIWTWITNNVKLVGLIIAVIFLTIFVLWWGAKNRKVRELENALSIANAKLKVERLAIKYNTTMQEIKELKEKDEFVSKELAKIEESLGERLKPNMTAEEIVAKFKEIGLR